MTQSISSLKELDSVPVDTSTNRMSLKMREVMRANVPFESRPFLFTRSRARRMRRRQFAKDFPNLTPTVPKKKKETANETVTR